MDAQDLPNKTTVERFFQALRRFANSEAGWRAKLIFAALVALLCLANGLNVLNSYVGRNFMTSIADRNKAEFVRQAIFYVGVFAGSTVVAVIARFAEERLGLLWRESLTREAVRLYLANGTYYRLDASGGLANPDQRIAEDVRAFTVTTLSFVLMLLNGTLTIIAFSGVLWAISPLLFIVAVLYAACGSLVTFAVGRPQIKLNHDQLDKEASFRSALIHVRENAESIMLAHREERQTARLLDRFAELVSSAAICDAVSCSVAASQFSSTWGTDLVPGIGRRTGEWWSSQARATWVGVAPVSATMDPIAVSGPVSAPDATGNHGMNPIPCDWQWARTSAEVRLVRLNRFWTDTTGTTVRATSSSATDTWDSPTWATLPSLTRSASSPNCSSAGTLASMRWSWNRSIRSRPSRRRLSSHCWRRYSGRPTGSHCPGP